MVPNSPGRRSSANTRSTDARLPDRTSGRRITAHESSCNSRPKLPKGPNPRRKVPVGSQRSIRVQEAQLPEFMYRDMLPTEEDPTEYRLISTEGVEVVSRAPERDGIDFLKVAPEALELLSKTAFHDISHYLRTAHLEQVATIIDDPEASPNDRYLLPKHCCAMRTFPQRASCRCVRTPGPRSFPKARAARPHRGNGRAAAGHGVFDAYTGLNPCYSQNAPLSMFEEVNTGSNLPAQIELCGHRTRSRARLQVPLHGQGRRFRQQVLPVSGDQGHPERECAHAIHRGEDPFARDRGLPALPPALVVGGTSAEFAMRTAKYASAHSLDELPDHGGPEGYVARQGNRGPGTRPHSQDWHRRTVRWQVLLPRRARHPPAAPRRLASGGARSVLFRGPSGAR